MNLLWVQVCTALASIVTVMVIGPPAFVKVFNEWLRKPFFELKIWCVPVFGQSDAAHMYCTAKLKVLKK